KYNDPPDVYSVFVRIVVFFFQAEEGVRERTVAGVQTCALPMWIGKKWRSITGTGKGLSLITGYWNGSAITRISSAGWKPAGRIRSEERRVGKENEGQREAQQKRQDLHHEQEQRK